MNYLELIVGFSRWKEVNPLPASAIALWYELVSACNKAGWPEEFTLRSEVLQANAGVSRGKFERARQQLVSFGLIHYKKSNRMNCAGNYKIISRAFKMNIKTSNETRCEIDNETGDEMDAFKDNKSLKKTKTKKSYAQFVKMTEAQYQNLSDDHGKEFADACIAELNSYKGASGKTYKDDYLAILRWVVDKIKQKHGIHSSKQQRAFDLLDQIAEEGDGE
ncbi:hypothetical protein ACFOQM_12545 [Paenibacillus sp. GCM10012307]|uniref:Helix-turn-helix domain-containing protein n=1 Tax=Paenibacillus roseus TaxID=2798579 RepID=A0A934J7F4_9BACL|nr:hypothetical protein [Paenibacillus roseus]MBJ6362121.1 hypothetical protein [Paenibacillus roseus]